VETITDKTNNPFVLPTATEKILNHGEIKREIRKNEDNMYFAGQMMQRGMPYLESLSQKFVAGHQNREGVIRQVKEIGDDGS